MGIYTFIGIETKILSYLKIEHYEYAKNIRIYNLNITQLGLGANISNEIDKSLAPHLPLHSGTGRWLTAGS